MRDDRVYLKHILDAIEQIEEYLEDVSQLEFERTNLLQDGVARQLEIIGEASRNVSDSLHQAYSEVPWRQVIGMRNRIVHEYFNVNLTIMWEVTQHDLPSLKNQIQQILNELG